MKSVQIWFTRIVVFPKSFMNNFSWSCSINTTAMSFSIWKISLEALVIRIDHNTIADRIASKSTLKSITFFEFVDSFYFLIILPLSLKLITIHIVIETDSLFFPTFYCSLIILSIRIGHLSLSIHLIIFKLSVIITVILPYVSSVSLFFRVAKVSLINVSIVIY